MLRKTYSSPKADSVSFDTEEVLGISFTGNGSVLEEKTDADKKPASDFGNIDIY